MFINGRGGTCGMNAHIVAKRKAAQNNSLGAYTKIKDNKMKRRKIDFTQINDDALRIMYAWANNAIICRTAQQTERITAIITEYQRRGL